MKSLDRAQASVSRDAISDPDILMERLEEAEDEDKVKLE